jgi:hydrogenase maturation protease
MNTRGPAGPTTAVLGLGNVLMGDDGLGPTVIAHLQARFRFPAAVRVEDLGTPGLDLHPHIVDADELIVVDTVRADAPAGTLRLYDRQALLQRPPPARTSPHDPSLKDALLSLQFAGAEPEVLLVGVVPRSTENRLALSAEVAAAVEPAIAAVLARLAELGHPVEPVAAPQPPDLWWLDSPQA